MFEEMRLPTQMCSHLFSVEKYILKDPKKSILSSNTVSPFTILPSRSDEAKTAK